MRVVGEAEEERQQQQQQQQQHHGFQDEENHTYTNNGDSTTAASNDEDSSATKTRSTNFEPYQKFFLGLVGLAFLAYVVVDYLTTKTFVTGLYVFLDWVKKNQIVVLADVAILHIISTILIFIPKYLHSIVLIISGFVFGNTFGYLMGLLIGTGIAFVGVGSGAILSFFFGRYFISAEWIHEHITVKYVILDIFLYDTPDTWKQNGFMIISLLRLSGSVLPLNEINYVAGSIKALPLFKFIFTIIGILPYTTLLVFVGVSTNAIFNSVTQGDNNDYIKHVVIALLGSLFGKIVLAVVGYYANLKLDKIFRNRLWVIPRKPRVVRTPPTTPLATPTPTTTTPDQSIDIESLEDTEEGQDIEGERNSHTIKTKITIKGPSA